MNFENKLICLILSLFLSVSIFGQDAKWTA